MKVEERRRYLGEFAAISAVLVLVSALSFVLISASSGLVKDAG